MLDLVFVGVATWYLTYVLVTKRGPWEIFSKFRKYVTLGGLTQCMPCFSVWIAAILLVLWYSDFKVVVVCLGVAGIALMLGSYTGADRV